MSSEEETDSQGLCDGLDRKQKRPRQRVDAGEPRNTYSSVPNFNARPGFMSGGIYGAIFDQGRQHFGLFGPGYQPKMLNELLGRPPKQEAEEDAGNDLNVIRDILRKKQLMKLERELRGDVSPDNNNVLANNNNDEPKRDTKMDEECERLGNDGRDINSELERREMEDTIMAVNGNSDSRSLPSPSSMDGLVTPKTEPDTDADKDGTRSPNSMKGEKVNAKRARVENIVSTMRSSPAPPTQPQVNGCKKRKRYLPQQHDGERYGPDSHMSIEEDEDESERAPIPIQKLVQKSVLETHLKALQDQLAEMQNKYVQLCSQKENESESQEDKNSSDVEHIEDNEKPSPVASPKEMHAAMQNNQANMISQMMSKIITAKMGHVPHSIPPGFNGSLDMMPHISNHYPHPGVRPPNISHPNLNNAAAMYFSQKMYMEQQQARMKEAAQAEIQNHQQHQKSDISLPQSQQHSPSRRTPFGSNKASNLSADLQERLESFHSNTNSVGSITGADLESLAQVLKNEITASLTTLIDSTVARFINQRRYLGKQGEAAAAAAEQLNKDMMLASRLLERKSPQMKQSDRHAQLTGNQTVHSNLPPSSCSGGIPNGVHFMNHNGSTVPGSQMNGSRPCGPFPPNTGPEPPGSFMNQNTHIRPPSSATFQTPRPPQVMTSLLAAMNGSVPLRQEQPIQEQNEAVNLTVTPSKRKRHKVTDTRITPRTVNRVLLEGAGPSPIPDQQNKFADSPSPQPYHSLPTSVAIPNPSLQDSQFPPYGPFFAPHGLPRPERDSPPLPHPTAVLYPSLISAAGRHPSPDYFLEQICKQQRDYMPSPSDSTELGYIGDGSQPTHSSTLTPMHLRKAKLMFFWVRYPSSQVLKNYFPDIKFNKNNTAQLVKWFSNFREFYYIQMEKYARQAIAEGAKAADELHVASDSEIYRALNLHYNRNNHIEVPSKFRFVVEQTLKEFFNAIQAGKDTEQSWKKSIYKIISRLDDLVPEYFKSPNFLEQLE